MALRNAILAALLDGESSGYDLAKAFDFAVANFWAATPQQLYREMDRLEADGLVAARVVRQAKRPDKRVFRLTDAGRAALREFTATAARPTAIRDELLVKVQAVDEGEPERVVEAVRVRLEQAEAKLDRYRRGRDRLLDGRTEEEYLAGAPRIGPYLTLARGIAFEKENVRWCRQTIAALRRRTS